MLAKLTKNSKFNLTSLQHFCVHLLSLDQDARHFSEEKFSRIGCVLRGRSVCPVPCVLAKLIKNVELSLTLVLLIFFCAFKCKNFSGPWTCLECMVFCLCWSIYSDHLGSVIPNFSCFGVCGSRLVGFNDNYSSLRCSE